MIPHTGADPSRLATPGRGFAAILAVLSFLVLAAPARAETGLPLPRFASMRADEVNLRTGPGVRYPVEWVLVQRDLPMLITAEFGTWRKVRDWQGTEGWVHQTMLSGRRTAIIIGGIRPLMQEPAENAPVVARVEERVIGRLLACEKMWCRLEIADLRGWMRREHFWGVLETERGGFD